MTCSESNYGKIAVMACKTAATGIDALVAWEVTAESVLAHSPTAARKSCPKMAFLGLVNAGQIAGVHGDPTKMHSANGDYALAALHLLRQEPSHQLDPTDLWRRVMELKGFKKRHNAQMHVVVALWNERLFDGQCA